MIIILLIIFFSYILLDNIFLVVREGHTNKCNNADRECSKAALYKAEQNAPVIEKKIDNTKSFLNDKFNDIKKEIENLAKKQKETSKLISTNQNSIKKVKEELEE